MSRPRFSLQVAQYWWVFAFCILATAIYVPSIRSRNLALSELQFRFSELEKETLVALQNRESLEQQIASQADPAWIEIVLLRELGVVPDGFLKVHFKK